MLYDQLNFGKYRHQPLNRVPATYLQWLLREVSLTTSFRAEITAELSRRGQEAEPAASPAGGGARVPVDLTGTLCKVRRRLSLQHHPDRGGSIERMQGINLALDAVQAELAGVG